MAYEYLKKLFGKNEDGSPEALTAEQLEQKIEGDRNISIVNLKDGGYVSHEKFTAKETELSGVKKQLEDANNTIKSYTDMDVDGIKKSAKEWEEKYKNETKALKEQMEAQERSHQTDMFLSGYKFSSKAAQAGIRMEFEKKQFKLEDGEFLGAKDYMKSLMESDDYKGAFVTEKKQDDESGSNNDNSAGNQDGNSNVPPNPANLPQFAAATNGGNAGGGQQNPFMNFGFTTVRPMPENNR